LADDDAPHRNVLAGVGLDAAVLRIGIPTVSD